jgi:hypothetical protein
MICSVASLRWLRREWNSPAVMMNTAKKNTWSINPETTMLRPASMIDACAGGPLSTYTSQQLHEGWELPRGILLLTIPMYWFKQAMIGGMPPPCIKKDIMSPATKIFVSHDARMGLRLVPCVAVMIAPKVI